MCIDCLDTCELCGRPVYAGDGPVHQQCVVNEMAHAAWQNEQANDEPRYNEE